MNTKTNADRTLSCLLLPGPQSGQNSDSADPKPETTKRVPPAESLWSRYGEPAKESLLRLLNCPLSG